MTNTELADTPYAWAKDPSIDGMEAPWFIRAEGRTEDWHRRAFTIPLYRPPLRDEAGNAVARAVAAERERCAKIADTIAKEPDTSSSRTGECFWMGRTDAAEDIAIAIRGGTTDAD